MDKKPSEYIEEFLKFIRESTTEYNMAVEKQAESDMETQDICIGWSLTTTQTWGCARL